MPHEPGRLILSLLAFKDFLVRLERKDGLPRIVVRDRATGEEHTIAFDEEAYSLGLSGSYEYDTDIMRFSYSSMTTPAQVFDYDMRTRERVLLKTQEVPSGHDPDHYVTRRLMAPSHDGELVPVSLLYHRDTPLDGIGALPALRLRRLRHHHSGRLQHQLPVAGRSRLRLCHRPCPRRQGQGLLLVRGRQAGEEDQHLPRLHRRRRASRRPSATPRTTASSRRAARPAAC